MAARWPEREAADRAGGVGADALERQQRLLVRGQLAAVARHRLARDRVQPPRPDVVAERPPRRADVLLGRRGERLERRVLLEPLVVLRQHAIDLRLLQHHLRHEDVVRVVGARATAGRVRGRGTRPAGGGGTADAAAARRQGAKRTSTPIIPRVVKIYTKTGDAGETSLFDNTRVSKADARVDAYGEVDELNACLGAARAAGVDAGHRALRSSRSSRTCSRSARGSPIPSSRIAARVTKAAVTAADVERLEQIDRPARGRAAAAAPLHPARRIAGRRAAAPGAHGLPARRAPRRRARRRTRSSRSSSST